MSNRAYLLTVNDPTITWSQNPEQEIVAEGIDEIPVFWGSLFTPADRRMDTYEGEEQEQLEIPNWCVATDVAKQRLTDLREKIAPLLAESGRRIWEDWVEHLQTESSGFLKTNAAEVWALAPNDLVPDMETLMQAFLDPSAETMSRACKLNDLSYIDGQLSNDWGDEEATVCKLAGASHIRAVPWYDL